MAEPSTTAVASAATAGVFFATLLPGIEPNTLFGALAGATLFVMSAKDLNLFTRLVYLAISLVMGYLGGPAVLGHLFDEPAVSAFLFAAGVIGLGLKVIGGIETLELRDWFKPGGK